MIESKPIVDPLGVYSVKRACAELGVCYKTLRKYRMNGYIQPINPVNQSNGRVSEASHKAIARHELFCTFEDVVKAAAKLLRPGGRFYLVHRPFRLAEIISCMVQYKLEPKRMRLVYPYVDKEPNMVLIEGVRGGNRQLTVEKPLIAYEDTNQYTEEVRRMYYD